MSALQIVNERLSTWPPLIALVPAERIYPMEAPQTAPFPHIITNLIFEGDINNLDGAGQFFHSRVQVRAIAAFNGNGTQSGPSIVNAIGQIIYDALKDNAAGDVIAGFVGVDFYKAGADATLPVDQRSAIMRTQDFYVLYRG